MSSSREFFFVLFIYFVYTVGVCFAPRGDREFGGLLRPAAGNGFRWSSLWSEPDLLEFGMRRCCCRPADSANEADGRQLNHRVHPLRVCALATW